MWCVQFWNNSLGSHYTEEAIWWNWRTCFQNYVGCSQWYVSKIPVTSKSSYMVFVAFTYLIYRNRCPTYEVSWKLEWLKIDLFEMTYVIRKWFFKNILLHPCSIRKGCAFHNCFQFNCLSQLLDTFTKAATSSCLTNNSVYIWKYSIRCVQENH